MHTEKNIVIVGGGFAGTTLAKSLLRRLPPGHRVVLVSEESYTTFNPMLATLASICALAPLPMPTSATTAPTPMISPKAVKLDRSLFRASARRATLIMVHELTRQLR